uniref:LicD/FKTN/FKRP nucleotidyltransferase domain-containing protein n=1 Tax=viral metagenome TaxID=1070528 RepID=A0A6C0JUB1_9ZZZZ
MAGTKHNQTILNNTLMFIIKLLNDNNINNWFIGYGTLLGIIRDNSCIDKDDDVDIIIDKSNYALIKELLIKNNIIIEYGYGINKKTNILKTKETNEYCSVDFYMASIDEKGNFNDTWEKVIWSECYNETKQLITHIWNENILYLPFNYENKLINRYGETWRIPQNIKSVTPRKKIL